MSKIIHKWTGKTVVLDQNWWFRYMERFCHISDQCIEYINTLRDTLPLISTLFTYNIDKRGVMRRHEKASYKACVHFKHIPTVPRFVEQTDACHFSLERGCLYK